MLRRFCSPGLSRGFCAVEGARNRSRRADVGVVERPWNGAKASESGFAGSRSKGLAFHGATHGLASGADSEGRVKSQTLARRSSGGRLVGNGDAVAARTFDADGGVNAMWEGLGGTSSSQGCCRRAWPVGPDGLEETLLMTRNPTSIPTLLPLLNPTQLLMKQEPLPPKMLLLSRTGMKHQLRTENVNTHAPQPVQRAAEIVHRPLASS